MKLFLFFILAGSLEAWATPCNVFGISDSPQNLRCTVGVGSKLIRLDLSCRDREYYFHWKNKKIKVETAYHEDVEFGSSPLIFEGGDLRLTSVSKGTTSAATLRKGKYIYRGRCKVKN